MLGNLLQVGHDQLFTESLSQYEIFENWKALFLAKSSSYDEQFINARARMIEIIIFIYQFFLI